MFGYKNHIGIDRAHGLIRTWGASAANAHDGARLPDVVSKDNTGAGVWADTACRSKKNEAFLAKGMFTSHIHQKKPPRRPMPERIARANAKRSKVRAHVEHVFAGQKHRMGLVVRTIGIARARLKIGMANLAYNFQRLAWLQGRTAPARRRNAAFKGQKVRKLDEDQPIIAGTSHPNRLHHRLTSKSVGSSRCPTSQPEPKNPLRRQFRADPSFIDMDSEVLSHLDTKYTRVSWKCIIESQAFRVRSRLDVALVSQVLTEDRDLLILTVDPPTYTSIKQPKRPLRHTWKVFCLGTIDHDVNPIE